MARYIDAEKAEYPYLSMSMFGLNSKDCKIYNEGVKATEDMIQAQPTADVVEVKQIEIIKDDLKWWLETNTEKGVVYIPKFVVENMIAKMEGNVK